MLNTHFENRMQFNRVIDRTNADLNRAITKRNWEITGLVSSIALAAIGSTTIFLAGASLLLTTIATGIAIPAGFVAAALTIVGLGSTIKFAGFIRMSNRKVAQLNELKQNIQMRGFERRSENRGQDFERHISIEQERLNANHRSYQENLRDYHKPLNTVSAQSIIRESNSVWGIGKTIFSEIDNGAVKIFKENIETFKDKSKSMASNFEKIQLFQSIMGVENVALEDLEKFLSWIEVDSNNHLILNTPPEELALDKILSQCICPVIYEYPKIPLMEVCGEACYFYDTTTIDKLPEPKISPINRLPFNNNNQLIRFPDLTWIIQFRLFQKAILKVD